MIDDDTEAGTITAIPTTWSGIRFKSRLEARFAQWISRGLRDSPAATRIFYEPHRIGRNQYLPDFLIAAPDDNNVYIEIKPFKFANEAWIAIEAAIEAGVCLMLIDAFGRDVWGCFGSVVDGEVDYYTTLLEHVLTVGMDTERWRPIYYFGRPVSEA